MKIGAAGTEREVVEDRALRRLRLDAIAGLVSSRPEGIPRRIGDVAHNIWGVEAASVDSVKNDSGAVGTVNDVSPLRKKGRENETGRDENEFSLAGHAAQTAQSIFHVAVGIVGRGVAVDQGTKR